MSYYSKEIPEWSSKDIFSYFNTNNFNTIAHKAQQYNLSGFDLFYLTLEDLKCELGFKDYHDRLSTYKEIKKLISEHLKLTIVYEGECFLISLDSNFTIQYSQLIPYIASYFNIDPKEIVIKDSRNIEVLSPTNSIVELMLLSPEKYKTINISKMSEKRTESNKEILQQQSKGVSNTKGVKESHNNTPKVGKENNNQDYYYKEYKVKRLSEPYTRGTPLNIINYNEKEKTDDSINNSNTINGYFSRNTNNNNFKATLTSNLTKDSSNNNTNTIHKSNNHFNSNQLNNINTPSLPHYRSRQQTPNRSNNNTINNDYSLNNNKIGKYDSNRPQEYLQENNESSTIKNRTNNNKNTYYQPHTNNNQGGQGHKTHHSSKSKDKEYSNNNPLEIRYKSEKRFYRQPEQIASGATIPSDLIKTNHYLNTENSFNEEDYQFFNNNNPRKNDMIKKYSHYNSNNNSNNNYSQRLPNQKPMSGQIALKQHRTYHEDFIDDDDDDFGSNNENEQYDKKP